MKIAVIVPCLNEEVAISHTLNSIRLVVPGADIYVIDNGSTDRTAEIATISGALVLREPQRGKGFAVRRALSVIPDQYDAYFMVDGDHTYDVTRLPEAILLIVDQGYDLVVGKRFINQTEGARQHEFKFGHTLGNKFLTKAFRLLFGVSITDTLSGWRVMSPGYIRSFAGGASGFDIEAELNVHCYSISAAVTEIPVLYRGRMLDSHSKLHTYRDGWLILKRNLRLYRSEKPLTAYSLLALPWASFSAVLMFRVIETFQRTKLVPHFPSLIAAVGMFTVACNLWVTGMILEKTRQTKVALARLNYRRR